MQIYDSETGKYNPAQLCIHLKGYIFLSEQYKQLQELWTKVIEKNNALIVLKKI